MIGSGYVGLVSGACFADFGHEVVCVDKDEGKIARLNANIMPIYEPGLDALVKTNVDAGRLSFSTDVMQSVKGCGAIFIAVGTPSRRGDGHADLSYVYAAAEELARAIDPGTVVVTKSTVPVGTGDGLSASFGKPALSLNLPLFRTRNSCAKARPLAISNAPTALSWAAMSNGPAM